MLSPREAADIGAMVGTAPVEESVRRLRPGTRTCTDLQWRTVGPPSYEGTVGVYVVEGVAVGAGRSAAFSLALKLCRPAGQPRLQRLVQTERAAYRRLANLTGTLRSARCFGELELGDCHGLWLEDLGGLDELWSPDAYLFAAEAIGSFHGASLRRRDRREPWMGRPHLEAFCRATSVQRALDGSRSALGATMASLIGPILHLWDRRQALFDHLDTLPAALSHQDYQRRNLYLATERAEPRVIAIDWAYCGLGVLGQDCGILSTSDLLSGRASPAHYRASEPAVFASYLTALRKAGYDGPDRTPRLGHLVHGAVAASLRSLFGLARADDERTVADTERARDVLEGLAPLVREAMELAGDP